jgi:hypothetical protein
MRVAAIVAFMLVSGAVFASQAEAQDANAMKVLECLEIKDSATRLACFDVRTPLLKPGPQPAAKGLGIVTRAPAPATAPAAPAGTASIVPTQTLDRISVGVSAIGIGPDGKLRFTLSNGETWRQTDSTALKNLGKGPWEAELRKAALGSYMLRIGNKAAVRVAQVK